MSDRKYRHRGYQDDDRSDRDDRDRRRPERGAGPGRPPRLDGAPRGRGLGAPTSVVFKCAVCGAEQKKLGTVEPDSACSACGKPLHTCTNCTFFDPGARFECRKPLARRIESKSAANSCKLFKAKEVRDLSSAEPANPQDARAAFDALFKK
jgi:hypothetical protein